MLLTVHVQLLQQALTGKVSPRALGDIISANLHQDSLRYQFGHDEFHFDNNAFAAGRAYIESQRLLIQPALQAGEAAQARAAFGRLSHTAQDFYAHTNYVDLWLNAHSAGSASSAIDPLDSEILNDPRLHSGRLYYPQEALYFIPFLRKFSLSILPPDSHAHMNLDSAGQGRGFEYAFHAALKRTLMEFELVRSLLPAGLFTVFTDLET
ncbi:MAG TPA: hypothetical protein VIV15_12770 [Anaerolineales bacterium]